jgi:hypothetical protein
MENGFLRVPRFCFSSPAWKTPRTFSTFEAYLDLLQCAAWRHMQFFYKGLQIPIEPGELITSSTKLAQRWGWTRDDVRHWLRRLSEAKVLSYQIVESALKISLDVSCSSRFCNLPAEDVKPAVPAPVLAQAIPQPTAPAVIPEAAAQNPAGCVNDLVAAIIKRAPAAPSAAATPAPTPTRTAPEPPTETTFPEDFPMEEFRAYLEKCLHPASGQQPFVHRGWVAEMRDKFLQERAAEQAKREAESATQKTAEPKVDQTETKQAA